MPPKQQQEKPADQEKQKNQTLDAVIGKHVLHALGQPANLCRLQVRRLWEGHYRVNVLVGDLATMRVTHSYFLVADGDGNIVASTPALTRQH